MSEMSHKKLLAVLESLDIPSFRQFAMGIGEDSTNLYRKINRGTLYAKTIKKIIDYLGLTPEEVMDIFFTDIDTD